MRRILPLALLLGACATSPLMETGRSGGASRAPALVPLGGLLAQADALALDADLAPSVTLAQQGRASDLATRAAALRGSVLTEAERQRLDEGPAPVPPALP